MSLAWCVDRLTAFQLASIIIGNMTKTAGLAMTLVSRVTERTLWRHRALAVESLHPAPGADVLAPPRPPTGPWMHSGV